MSKDKTIPIFGLEKVPDDALLKFANFEIGTLKSYIDELQYENELLKKEIEKLENLNSQERKEFLQTKLGNLMSAQITDLQREVKNLKRNYEILLNKYLVLKEGIKL